MFLRSRPVGPVTLEAILNSVGYSRIISCDIFDTAIERILARPDDVLLAVGARARAAGLTRLDPDSFATAYRIAAQRVRTAATAQGWEEVRISEIYDELHAVNLVTDPIRAARLEFQTECSVCRAVEPTRTALLNHIAAGRTVVFASDTNLPGAWLSELLEACGYGPGHRVFSSADLRLGKYTGNLFPAMLDSLQCAATDLVHVGDNPTSDVIRPRARGITAHHVPRPRAKAETDSGPHYLVRLHESRQRMLTSGETLQHSKDPTFIGRMLAARATPLLIGFSLFVMREAKRLGIDRIWLLARDGYLPLEIIRRILARSGEPNRLDLQYLAVSRRAAGDPAAMREYLRQVGFLEPGRHLVVDVGWRGSLQRSLTEVAGHRHQDVYGCYVGLWSDALCPTLNPDNATGYLFSFGSPSAIAARIREAHIVLEMIFSAPHGTVIAYERANGTVRPIHAPDIGPDGDRRRAVFAAMEAACLDAVDDLGDIVGNAWPTEIDPASALAPIESLLVRPSIGEVAMVNSVSFINDLESDTLLPIMTPLPLHEAIMAPRQSLMRLGNTPWRAGAVRAALPWPLPGMSYETLRYRAERVLDVGAHILRLFSGRR